MDTGGQFAAANPRWFKSLHAHSIDVGWFGMEFDTPSPLLSKADQDGACHLIVLCGDLGAEGDMVETAWNGSTWELPCRVGGSRSLRASAACFGRNDGVGVPSAG